MTKAAASDRAVGQAIGLYFRRRNDIRECLERTVWMGCHDVGRGADQQHRFEVLLGVERKVLQEGIDRMGVEHEYPVAIRRGLCDLRGADASGGAGFVLDDDDGAEPLLQSGLHHPSDRIDRAAGREWNDDSGDVARGRLAERRLSDWHCHSAEHERASCDRGHRVSFELPSQSRSGYCTSSRPLHSITSSALACKVNGTARPSALAVFKLTTSSNLVGCMTGI